MTTTSRPPILTPALMLRFVSIIASSVGFYLPLAVIPMFADGAGSRSAAGMATGALLLASVAGELVTTRIVARIGYRPTLAAGLALLGAPSLVLLAFSSVPVIVAVNAARGAGFGSLCVAGGALTAALIPDERRGEGLALAGIVGGIPALLALPFGAWAAGHLGYDVVFVLTAAVPLAAIATVPGLPRRDTKAPADRHGVTDALRNSALLRPAVIFATSASAAGVVVTYLPLALSGRAAWAAPAALFLQPAAATAGRWVAGRVGDRRGQAGLLLPGIALSSTGMAAMAVTPSAVVVALGAATFGTGFGILQNATLSLMYARVGKAKYSAASAIWNASYDVGMALGALGAGPLATATGFAPAFLVTAATMLPALLMSRREMTSRPDPSRAADTALRVEPVPA